VDCKGKKGGERLKRKFPKEKEEGKSKEGGMGSKKKHADDLTRT